MRSRSDSVSIHPYFKAHAGKLAEFKALLPQFVALTAAEPKCLYYAFTSNGDEIFAREAYADADGVLAHLASIGTLLGEVFKIADVVRLELHGPAAELEKLKGPFAEFKPTWFVYETGLTA